jgi:hypothetical protein
MGPIPFSIVDEMEGFDLGAADAEALAQIISWQRLPEFALPGRTAWYVLQEPVRSPDGTQLLTAAKLKGVGAWNPVGSCTRSGIRGENQTGLTRPSTDEYEDTTRVLHFGIDSQGAYASLKSEPAPFGAITVRRARQEYDNARTLYHAGVPAILPFAVYRYDDGKLFGGEPIGAVVSLAPDQSPYSLDFLCLGEGDPTPAQEAHYRAARNCLVGNQINEVATLSAQAIVGHRIGKTLRQMAQAGLYRYSAGWDNFYLNKNTGDVYLTDLDSTRRLSELPPEIGGMQVMRDMAGALYRFTNKLYHPNIINNHPLRSMLDINPLASIVSGYFDIDPDYSRKLVAPLWNYFAPHWFLVKRYCNENQSSADGRRKTYKMDKDVFHGLAILALAQTYHDQHVRLGLPAAPSYDDLRGRLRNFLRERMDIVELQLPELTACSKITSIP